MAAFTLQLIKKPRIYDLIVLYARTPLYSTINLTHFFWLDRVGHVISWYRRIECPNRMDESTQRQSPGSSVQGITVRFSGCCAHDMVVWIGGMKVVGVVGGVCLPNFSHLVPLPSPQFSSFLLPADTGVERVSGECEKTTLFNMDRWMDGSVLLGGGWARASLSGVTYSQHPKNAPSLVWNVASAWLFISSPRLSFRSAVVVVRRVVKRSWSLI